MPGPDVAVHPADPRGGFEPWFRPRDRARLIVGVVGSEADAVVAQRVHTEPEVVLLRVVLIDDVPAYLEPFAGEIGQREVCREHLIVAE